MELLYFERGRFSKYTLQLDVQHSQCLTISYVVSVQIIPRHIIVAGYYGITLAVCVFVCLCTTVRTFFFSFLGNYLSKCQWIVTKLSVGINIVEIWFGIANGQILSVFDRVIRPRHVHIVPLRIFLVNTNGVSSNLVCALIL